MTRYLFSLGAAGMAILAAMIMLKMTRVHKPLEAEELAFKVDGLISQWTAARMPLANRTVTFLISDSEDDYFKPPSVPSAWMRLKQKLGFGSGSASADAPFLRAFPMRPEILTWKVGGFSPEEEQTMMRQVVNAIVKAHDAGAEVDIVTRGRAAAPVLKAIKSLDGTMRGGASVGVNKLVAVGMSRRALTRLDPEFSNGFEKPHNLLEWANFRDEGTVPRAILVEFFYGGSAPMQFSLPAEDEAVVRLIAELVSRVESISSILSRLNAPAPQATPADRAPAKPEVPAARKESDPRAVRTFRNREGRTFQKEIAAPRPSALGMPSRQGASLKSDPAPQGDSLSFIQSAPDMKGATGFAAPDDSAQASAAQDNRGEPKGSYDIVTPNGVVHAKTREEFLKLGGKE